MKTNLNLNKSFPHFSNSLKYFNVLGKNIFNSLLFKLEIVSFGAIYQICKKICIEY
jgi:hypothetical protein